ncbi:MAG: enhanced intracellular survival protein Eis [Bacillota bacterium]
MDGGSPRFAYAGFRGDLPVSYAIYSIGSGGESASIRVMDVSAIDAGAWRDLLGFLSMHVTDAGKLDIYLPVDSPVRLLLPEANKAVIQPSLMLRVVDVEGVLNLLAGPPTPGVERLLLGIRDPICPWNNGVFQLPVGVGPEGTLVQGTRMAGDNRVEPEVVMEMATFSQIVSGYVTPVRAAEVGKLHVRDGRGLEKLTRAFPGRTTFTADFY